MVPRSRDLRLPRGIHGQSVSNIPGLEAIF
ncbi:unnamed protein product, partial [Vitis vinifera]|uniref:Uncharacterized protein n=1 Tax=Vitis vinifera TaxID=29760 RepID=D7U5U5_VITVI